MAEREQWRVEADEQWLATHRSTRFARLRRMLRRGGVLGDAVSQAELGPFGGAPRNPSLKVVNKPYSTVRHSTQVYAYTTLYVEPEHCPRCGGELAQRQRISCVREDGEPIQVGAVRRCARCQGDSWPYVSRMPATVEARERGRKVVL